MKKKTGILLGFATVCVLGLGTGVKASTTQGNITFHHASWHESCRDMITSSKDSNSTTTQHCIYGHENCDGHHESYTDTAQHCVNDNQTVHHQGHHERHHQ